MKIAWFTPLSERSAIGRANTYIVRELAKIAEVELWHFEKGPLHPVDVKTVFAPTADLSRLAYFNVIVYHFGNHLPYHGEIYKLSRQYPGIVVLHDYVMHHFFAALFLEEQRDPGAYTTEMERWYGAAGRAAAERSLAGQPVWESDDAVHFPLVERITEGARAVVAHSHYLLKAVAGTTTGPARKIDLPYELPELKPGAGRASLGVPDDQLLLLTIGHVNANKRVHATLEAMGEGMHLVVAGPADPAYQKKLDAIVVERGLGSRVHFLGRVTDAVLHTCLMAADACVNLRFPAIEGASASVIEEMLYGKPVVVTDVGFYSELPADCVLKVALAEEAVQLRAALQRLLDREVREGLGQRAKEYAKATFRADNYAREILRLAWDVRNAQPIFDLSDKMAAEMERMGVTADMAIVDTVANEVAGLLCRPARG